MEDYGKVAATFVDTHTGRAVRVAPHLEVRQRAYAYAPEEPRHYFAQLKAYQIMPDSELLTIREVCLNTPIGEIVSRAGMRVNCSACGEEIINERELIYDGASLCRACAGSSYYHPAEQPAPLFVGHCVMETIDP